MPWHTLAALAALVIQEAPAQQARVAWVPNPRTANGAWVSDAAHHLRPATRDSLNAIISTLERETSAEIAVAVVDSTAGLEPQEFATALHRHWGVGKTGKDNGVLLLWDPVHRAVFISVGYGLEGAIPDRRAGRVRDQIIAAFRDSRFDDGILTGVRALAAAAREETNPRQGLTPAMRDAALRSHRAPPSVDSGGPIGWIVGILGSLVAAIGGLFGWKRWRRYRPRTCSNGHPMRLLTEREEDDQLDQGARTEERVGSVSWDVWFCKQCKEVLRIPYQQLFSMYKVCPQCKRRTAIEVTRTLVAATTSHGGREEVKNFCSNCGWKTVTERDTARKPVPSASPVGGGTSGGSSGGGGGGGGGSFGGGSAGGGGAGGRY